MSKAEYLELLKDPRWQKKRLQMMERDGWRCVDCGANNTTLHVHHTYYDDTVDGPWDYPDHSLITLCAVCHSAEEDALKEVRPTFTKMLAVYGFNRAEHLKWILEAVGGGVGRDFSSRPLSRDDIWGIRNAISIAIKELRAKP